MTRRTKQKIFVTGTGTDVGKTVATLVLGTWLQEQGVDVGVMKPVQCAGNDAAFLKDRLGLEDPLEIINPYYAPDPLSPHLAFARQKKNVKVKSILRAQEKLLQRHDALLIEGAGGLMVPIKRNYLMIDLIRDMNASVIITATLGLGTINHTLSTTELCRQRGLDLHGIIFNASEKRRSGLPEQTNPDAVRAYGGVEILGIIPYLRDFDRKTIVSVGRSVINGPKLFRSTREATRKSKNIRQMQEWDKQYVWHPFTQMKDWVSEEPLVIDRGEGSFLIDTHGRKYIDGVSSLWVNVHGHRNQKVDAAVKKQIDRLSHSTLLGLANTPSVQLAKELVSITPKGLDKVFYSDSGSTAVEIAVKMAYQYWQNIGRSTKKRLVHLANAYHGDTLGSVSVGGIGLFHKVYRDLVVPTIEVGFPDFCRAPKGKQYPVYTDECLDKMERLLREKHDTIAALIVEPIVQGAAGMIVWPDGVLRRMWGLCKKYDIIFIVDEVATGFGRTGKMFACEHEDVRPDIFCLAKGLTAGYLPLAATLTTKKIFNGFVFSYKDQKTFFHGHTYTGNPLGCAAALANLDIFRQDKTLANLQPKIKWLTQRLKDFNALPAVGDIRQKGFMVGIELVKDKRTKAPLAWEKKVGVAVCQKARERGVILRPLGNVIVLMPPLSINQKELKELLDVTYWAIENITARHKTS